ncbi:MAG: neutral/alkaline non-lysosomal ceramidase N-terminal domain-containing protein [Planctomycetes bacterium]|nr:neutral/alkaline non-lysosomal ceramidase N-terminal domain-containing protein [Planctomycetota bacterium]
MRKTFALLLLLGCSGSESVEPGLRAGTAKVRITPAEPVMLAGYASRNKPSEGVAADLWARALAIDDGSGENKVLVTADIIGFGPVISRAIKAEALKRYGLGEAALLLVGSHTHSGPVISERALVDYPEQVKVRDAYVDGLREKILGAIGDALKNLSPASLEWARGRGEVGMYRRVAKPDGTWGFGDNPQGTVDPDLPVMALRAPDGKLRALFFTYACHCTSIRNGKDGFYKVHPDWAICCSLLEEKMPGTQVMFVTGCGGDIDPGPKGPLSDAEKNGATLAASLQALIDRGAFTPVAAPIRAELRRIDLPLEKLDEAVVAKMAETGKPAEKKLALDLQQGKLKGGPISYPIVTWRFASGPAIVALAGETCVEYALRLKKELGADNVWPVGYANEVMCYIPSERVLRENGYESGWSLAWGRCVAAYQMSGSGWNAPFALGLEDRIVSTVHEMLKPEPLRAGASKVRITPEKFGWMTGYGNRNKQADGVKSDLWVRALALQDSAGKQAVLVTADLLGFPPQLSRAMRKDANARFGLDETAVMFVASHTHGGPAIPQRPSMEIFHGLDDTTGKDVLEYADWLHDRVMEAISKALIARKPAKLTITKACATFGMNRRFHNENGTWSIKDNPEGTVDPEVTIVRAESEEGKPLATIFTYACHCTTLGGNIYQYHGDWSGVACDEIEKASGGAPALFATGCGADLNPSPRGTFELADQHGRAMAAAVAGAPVVVPLSGPIRTRLKPIELALDKPPTREILEKFLADKNVFRQRHSREMLKLMDAGRLPTAVPYPVQAWHFGNQTLVALGGETCVEYALRLKKELGADRTWVDGYANEVPCYIPSEKVLAESGYEPGWDPANGRAIAGGSMMYYGWPVPFAPGIEERIISAARALAGE